MSKFGKERGGGYMRHLRTRTNLTDERKQYTDQNKYQTKTKRQDKGVKIIVKVFVINLFQAGRPELLNKYIVVCRVLSRRDHMSVIN